MKTNPRFIDINNQMFTKWTVLRFDTFKKNRAYWICRCECGTERSVSSRELRRGNSRSCGCMGNPGNVLLPNGEAAFRALVGTYKRNAKNRGYKWDLTNDQVRGIVARRCHYCGVEPKQLWKTATGSTFLYNGIDRMNNSMGYTPENAVPACKICNLAKNALTLDDFYEWIIRLVQNYFPPQNGLDRFALNETYAEQWPTLEQRTAREMVN